MPRRSVRFYIARIAALTIIAVAATTFGLAGSEAASSAVCSASSCVKETLLPHTLTVGASGLSSTRFMNQGTSTATHVSIATTFSAQVSITSIVLVVNGSVVSSRACVPRSDTSTLLSDHVSCSDVGDVSDGGSASLTVRYAARAVGSIQAFGSVAYGNLTNPQQSNVDTVNVVTGTPNASGKPLQAGKCTNFTIGTNNVAGGDTTLSAKAIYPATADPTLPCTPAAAGVIQESPPNIKTFIAFAEVPESSPSSFATVKIAFTPLPANTPLNTLVLLEDTASPPDFFETFITVPNNCDPLTGLPPLPGPPAPGSTDAVPHLNDTCIASRSPLHKGGGELVLHVIGFRADPRFGGG